MRGVYLHKSTHGYTACVDGQYLGHLDLSWSNAARLCLMIARERPPGDGRGWARCRHDGNVECFYALRCLRIEP